MEPAETEIGESHPSELSSVRQEPFHFLPRPPFLPLLVPWHITREIALIF